MKPLELNNGFSIQVFASGIAAMVNSGELSNEELAEVDKILSVQWMEENYLAHVYKRALIWEKDGSPEILADANLDIFNNKFVLDLGENISGVIGLYFSLFPKHIWVCVKDVISSLYILWGIPGVYLFSYPFLVLLIIYLTIRAKFSPADYSVFLPSLCNTISIAISTITNEKRYLLPTFMLAPIYFLYIMVKNEHRKSSVQQDANISK